LKFDKKLYDITVIGGGPTGLFTAFYGGMRNASVKIIESLPQLGGQLAALYPEKYIYDIAGLPEVSAQELIDNLKAQMEIFPVTISLDQAVQTVTKENNVFKLETDKEIHYTKTIIIAAGNGAFEPRRLKVQGSEQYENQNLHYFIDDLEQFTGKNVVVCGGGDSAVDWALMLEPIAKNVSIVHRRDKFRAHEHSVKKLIDSQVKINTPYEVSQLIGQDGKLEKVRIKEVKGEEEKLLSIDDLIVNYGFVSSLGPINDWGLKIEKNSIVVDSKMETNIPGIYAVGDICTYKDKIKLIATGFGEAPVAVSNAKAFIDPKVRVQPKHSTSIMEQKVLS